MELKRIYGADVTEACFLVRYVYDTCLRRTVAEQINEQTNTYFDDYMEMNHVCDAVERGELLLWGAYEKMNVRTETGILPQDCLMGVGGMTPGGQITLLYVHPYYQKRNYGSRLLEEMRRFAGTELAVPMVWGNVVPPSAGNFFLKHKFKKISGTGLENSGILPVEAKSFYQINYKKKHLPGWLIALITCGSVGLAFAVGVIYLLFA